MNSGTPFFRANSMGAAQIADRHLFRPGRPVNWTLGQSSGLMGARTSVAYAGPNTIVRWTFALFVLAIPFDTVNFPSEDFALTKTVGMLFLLTALLFDRSNCFRRPTAAFWALAIYATVYVGLGMSVGGSFRAELVTRALTWIQLLCLFWVSTNVMRYPAIVTDVWTAFVLGCVVLSVLQVTHIGGKGLETDTAAEAARSTTLGANANQLCGILALAAISLVGLVTERGERKRIPIWLALACFACLAAGMLSTVSRGGLMALATGLGVYLLIGHGSAVVRSRSRIVGLIGLGALFIAIMSNGGTRERFKEALMQGNFAKREFLYPAELGMFAERPLAGWGPVAHRYELGRRTFWAYHHEVPDTHNLFLWIATECGLLGLAPYLAFIGLCASAAIRAQRRLHDTQPLAMLATLFVVNASGTWIYYKLMYVVLAYVVARVAPFRSTVQPIETPSRRLRTDHGAAVAVETSDS